jgi:hypothetical protein
MFIYFVHLYRKPNMTPFYVGYGKNQRHLSHLFEAKSKPIPVKGEHKLNTIRKLLREGSEPIIQIVDNNLSKEQACELEEFLIDFIGRYDLKLGPLTNKTKGGDGYREWSLDAREKLSEKRKNKIAARNLKSGENFLVDKNDERWISGELVGQNFGKKNVSNKNKKLDGYILAKNPTTNEILKVKNTDERWISGELVGFHKGKPPHKNTIEASKARKGIPKPKEQNMKASNTIKQLKWYCNFETNVVGRFKEGSQPEGFVRVSGPHKKILI